MRKLILILALGLVLFNLVWAEECELALPRYGVVECYDMGNTDSMDISLEHGTEQSTGSFVCVSDCELNTMDNIPEVSCGVGWGAHLELYKNADIVYEESSTSFRSEKNIHFDYGDELSMIGYCRKLLGGKTPLPINKITILQKVVMLKEGWAGTLQSSTIDNTEGCVLNKNINPDTDINNYLNVASEEQESKPSSTYTSQSQFPINWRVGENYIFVKDWQTGIADISLVYGKDNEAYWCGGQTGSRKIYNVDLITSNSGKCYSIPKSIANSNIECCEDVDCLGLGFGAKYVCNPDSWKCEQTKPCNSQLDCESTFGEGVCENKEINKWNCDTSKEWGDYAGTCVNSIKSVSQCPSDCSNNEYYNEEEGRCKSLNKILDCPVGKCCADGGSYKEKKCGGNQECCTVSGAFVGICKDDCSQITDEELKTMEGFTGASIGSNNSSTGKLILVVFLILIGGAIVFFYIKNKKVHKTIKSKPIKKVGKVEEEKPVKKQMAGSKYCTACGYLMRKGSAFCTMCGKKNN